MTASSGTPLYLQVEEAINQFRVSVTKLRDQQAQTDGMLLKGTEALGNMVNQVLLMDKLKEEVDRELGLMEKYRSTISQDYGKHQAQTEEALTSMKSIIDVRRQEMLGMIRDLGQAQQKLEQALNQKLGILQQNLNNSRTDLKADIKILTKLQNNATTELFSKLEAIDARIYAQRRQLNLTLMAVGLIAVIALVMAIM